ncbi:MAG: hypothetical protein Q9227_007720 [Pyrenula ochraceoflavens]
MAEPMAITAEGVMEHSDRLRELATRCSSNCKDKKERAQVQNALVFQAKDLLHQVQDPMDACMELVSAYNMFSDDANEIRELVAYHRGCKSLH